jgi:hypothetical protein
MESKETKPNEQDQRKLHAEITQIANQRVTLVTVAIALLGVVLAWTFPRELPSGGAASASAAAAGKVIASTAFYSSALLYVLFFVIFWYNFRLTRNLRMFTTYLMVTGASVWERHAVAYRQVHGSRVYTFPQAWMFVVLGTIVAVAPAAVVFFKTGSLGAVWSWGLVLHVLLTGGYFVFVCGMGFGRWFDDEKKIADNWRRLLDSDQTDK